MWKDIISPQKKFDVQVHTLKQRVRHAVCTLTICYFNHFVNQV